MENQHEKITGYRNLSQEEIDAMNKVKELGAEIKRVTDEIAAIPNIDRRWLSIGITDLQKGCMAVTRSIAQPTTFA